MSKSNVFQKTGIVIDTMKDRLSANVEKYFKKPSKERTIVTDPFAAVRIITNTSEDLQPYTNETSSKNLLGIIDNNLQNRLPPKRYEKVKNFKNNKDWINILNSLYTLIRIYKPSIVVETGVGEIGMSTTYILAALHENNNGALYSIDPDKFYEVYGYHIGAGIPEEYRDRHSIVIGRSQSTMRDLLKRAGSVDIFLHDGDHRYGTKLYEYELAYEYVKNQGIILSDDTWDSAFDFFTNAHKIQGYSIKYGNNDYFSYSRFQKNQ